MKTLFKLLIFAVSISSCKHDEVLYSCDPILNQYVATHQNLLKSLSLVDLTNSDLVFQQAVFRSYDAIKKREVWMQRIRTLLETQNYSPDEFDHVRSLLDHIHVNYFVQENIESEKLERKLFQASWTDKAKNSLGWSDKQVAFVVYRLYTNVSQFDNELKFIQSIQSQDGVDPQADCYCSTSNDYCLVHKTCFTGSCIIKTGCGPLWSETCDGACR